MSRRTEVSFEKLESMRREITATLNACTEDVLNRTSPSGGWSPAEVLKHILDVESGTLMYCRKKLSDTGGNLPAQGFRNRRNAFLLRMALKSPVKFRVPAALPPVQGPYNTGELLAQWEELRKQYRDFIRAFPKGQEQALLFRHPRSGMLSLQQTLAFLDEHLRRHSRQIKRILKASAKS